MVDFKNASLIELKIPKNGNTTIVFFSGDGSNISYQKDRYDAISKIIGHGFSLVSESWTPLEAHMMYFQKNK